jgi:hypothetical protein
MQTRSSPMAPEPGARSPGTAGFARQPGFGEGGQTAVITQEPLNQAAAIREAAEKDAAAIRQEATGIREAAEKDAAHVREVILSLSEQLSEVSAHITENLASSGEAPTAPAATALVTAPLTPLPTKPATRPARPVTRPSRPTSRHARLVTKPGESTTRSTTGTQGRQARAARKMVALLASLTAPPRPATTPAQQTAGRQRRAMHVAAAATATLFMFAVVMAAVEIGTFGPRFFVFRSTGTGETGPNAPTDQQFLAQEAAAAKAAAQRAHTPGRHSAKSTSHSAKKTSGANSTSG